MHTYSNEELEMIQSILSITGDDSIPYEEALLSYYEILGDESPLY